MMGHKTINNAVDGIEKGLIERPKDARLPMMDVSEMSGELRTLASMGASNVLRMLAHREDLATAWFGFASRLTSAGRIHMRTRELVILKVGLLARSKYEWGNHVLAALSAGATAAEIESIANGTGSWSDADAAALNMVEDLFVDNCVSEKTWRKLESTYDTGEIIELLLLVGFYSMNAGFLNTLGVELEPGRPGLGKVMSDTAPITPERLSGTSAAEADSEVKPGGVWNLRFYHPSGTQELKLIMETMDSVVSGSVTNEAIGVIVPISEGNVDGHQITFTTIMTNPYPATIIWGGTINNDFIEGTATIKGAGSFPFDSKRIG